MNNKKITPVITCDLPYNRNRIENIQKYYQDEIFFCDILKEVININGALLQEKLSKGLGRGVVTTIFTKVIRKYCQNYNELQSLIFFETSPKIRSICLFERTCTMEQEFRLNSEFTKPCEKSVEFAIKLLRSNFLTLMFNQRFEEQLFSHLLKEEQKIEKQIQQMQEEFIAFHQSLVQERESNVIQNFKLKLDEETQKQVENLLNIFGENLFEEYSQHSTFNQKQQFWEFGKSLFDILQKSKTKVKELIPTLFYNSFYNQVCKLVEELH